jgi:membrane fusion protein, copper/silver efflux system
MKTTMIYLLPALLALGLLFSSCSRRDAGKVGDGTIYTCSMHPQIKQDKPGNCPICGMTLTPVAATMAPQAPAKIKEKATIYTCSMHPQIRQDKPGNCPICGMTLTLVPEMSDNMKSSEGTPAKPVVQLMPAQNSVGSIRVEVAVEKIISRPLQLFGEIKYISDNHLDLTSFYPGRVEHVHISYNTNEVKKGDALLDLYSEEAIADQEKYLQALRDRYLTTFYERKIATAQIETIRTRLLKAGLSETDLEALVKKGEVKRLITVRAASSGSIVGTMPHVGERMTQEAVLFHIAPLEKVWFAARVFEQDIAALKIGQSAEVQSKTNPSTKYMGKLVFIDRILDPMTRTVLARFEVENPKRELLPEMSATATVSISQGQGKAVLVVPESSVIDTGKRKIVYVKVGDNSYEQREVSVAGSGSSSDAKGESLVEITSGIQAGEAVVTSGAFLIDAEAQFRGASADAEHKH